MIALPRLLRYLSPALLFAPMPAFAEGAMVENPLSSNNFCDLLRALLDAAFIIGLPVAVLFIVYSGFKFVTAQGNATKLQDARRNFIYTVVGIMIFFGAWIITGVITNTINPLLSLSGSSQINSACGK